MFEALVDIINTDSDIKIQGPCILRDENLLIPKSSGDYSPVNLSENVGAYLRFIPRADDQQQSGGCAELYLEKVQFSLVFFQTKEKYTPESALSYLRAQISRAAGTVHTGWTMDKEQIISEEKLLNNQATFIKINFTYEYTTSTKNCAGLVCVC